jgi:MinD-like ATPase involved in chromosome partitioning or flagellar assembly
MRVVTFYSYKGGVGRTLALLNVAALLVRKGHQVLIADFDLEAPGLDAVSGLVMPAGPGRGVVEFISDYLAEGKVPDARDYCTEAFFRLPPEATPASTEGQLWVMPAGDRADEVAYKQRLSRISFAKLYTERDGFLLFEDLRSQWAKSLGFDYVLIDSRTGHTDVGGICTRQLPDHVVMVFFPNEQNLKGIEAEVRLIREQPVPAEIDAVISRIPNLDDHQQTLRDFMSRAKSTLNISRILKVHAYDDLKLLEDVVFSADGDSDGKQLSKDYRSVTQAILIRNRGDRKCVLATLKGGLAKVRRVVGEEGLSGWIRAIREFHRSDEAVLAALIVDLRKSGRGDEARSVEKQVQELTETSATARELAEALRLENSDPIAAATLASKVLKSAQISVRGRFEAFCLLCRVDPDAADRLRGLLGNQPSSHKSVLRRWESLSRCRGGMEVVLRSLMPNSTADLLPKAGLKLRSLHFGRSHSMVSGVSVLGRSRTPSIELAEAAIACGVPLRPLLANPDLVVHWSPDDNEVAVNRLPIEPFRSLAKFGAWLRVYSKGGFEAGPQPIRLFVEVVLAYDEDGPTETGAQDIDGSIWQVAGVPDDADWSLKSFPAIAYALFGQTDLARQLVRAIDDAIASGEASANDYVMNCWRMLNRPLSELRDDLIELAERRERDVAALGKGESLKILEPPFGQRRAARN